MLERIEKREDLLALSYNELQILAQELREEIETTVLVQGGHLASNLGMVEISIALHLVYDSQVDKILFDVGHQCYTHKILTGRKDAFSSLRSEGGVCGFPNPKESNHDAFLTGHASTAISAALGFARARDALGQSNHVVAVIGDGALTGGESYEALNDAGHSQTPMVVILNDNGMSINKNVGALTRYLVHARTAKGYWFIKNKLTHWLGRMPYAGETLYRMLQSFKNSIKYLFVKGQFFDALGFVYIGLVDGHDIREIAYTLRRAQQLGKPVLIHVITRKGKGIPAVESSPEKYHGVSPADAPKDQKLCSDVVASTLIELAKKDERVCAITAAMPQGTGLLQFANSFPKRMYDVGIAEEHAATLCAGLAAGGMRPYYAVYSTFFQRCFDQLAHDIVLQDLPVTFLLDRAGLTGEDGATHQGVYDIALSSMLPNMTILAPATLASLQAMLRWSLSATGPLLIRYPRSLPEGLCDTPFAVGAWQYLCRGERAYILAVGPMASIALEAAKIEPNISVISVESIRPLDLGCLRQLQGKTVLVVEEGSSVGGFGTLVMSTMAGAGMEITMGIMGTPRQPIAHATTGRQREICGLTPEGIVRALRMIMRPG